MLAGCDSLMPPGKRQQATQVGISLSLTRLFEFDQQAGTYMIDFFTRYHWVDPQLAYKRYNYSLGYHLPRLDLRGSKIWTPDVFFANAVKCDHNERETMWYTEPDGNITWSRRFICVMQCPMFFQAFPFDTQTCSLSYETYHERAEDVVLYFLQTKDPGFAQVSTSAWTDFSASMSSGIQTYSTGDFPSAHIKFTMKRLSYFWIVSVIIPLNIFVAMSYVGYWINPSATPGRISLAVLCVLITITVTNRVTSNMPEVRYRVWLVDYAWGCIAFNLIPVFSYAATNYGLTKKETKRDPPEHVMNPNGEGLEYSESSMKLAREMFDVRMGRIAVSLDWHLRWLFPVCFMLYTIVIFSIIGYYE
eukprot:TRINITY_DN6505_c0_g1_i1.p1 TRINITY_DN6505_c0_g1~~TRINITY_DN6505_c0_g1_i1.p1  ORF type:complete len:418 (+),score=11.39 TRINITY_DN6505_c0_g1_i1:172-1254(+)